ncbi:hypothetical protein PVK06_020131 [Gossypium arboreum]|uniref:Uncharacterized protein n=1 Tax=Gossypium arboreum TaxID=29729 RepID=A0ABR0PLU1_GOSAR|nr:hypothetical protein PVK06_020131 [Gossypium arboreum]
MVVQSAKPTLICTMWIGKPYNPESFRAQMKSIWKTMKKFKIQMAGRRSGDNYGGVAMALS